MQQKRPNHLLSENSPYLLQHAFNPVDWYPWGETALEKAKNENRLLVISIGYSACHWCHVMEHESFSDPEVAELMNRGFISVKVDREERPDVDQVYMTAAYLTSGRGGWPLNVIALPDQRPVFAGTYFNRADWIRILSFFIDAFRDTPDDLLLQAEDIGNRLQRQHILPHGIDPEEAGAGLLQAIYRSWKEDLDFTEGGTHGAPKFPMPVNLRSLLHYGHRFAEPKAVDYVLLTLSRMAGGGIFDQLGGGFSRYSVDASWQVPHFEKMLYDNAQLIALCAEAFAAAGKPFCREAAEQSIAFVLRELKSPEGLFYASLDADSEGEEGRYYAWTNDEIDALLADRAEIFKKHYGVEPGGNWEKGLNVLRLAGDPVDEPTWQILRECRQVLFNAREKRVRPATDKKILTGWNAWMIRGLVQAAGVFERDDWREAAVRAATFYADKVLSRHGKLWRDSTNGIPGKPAFLDDHAPLIGVFLDLYQATLDRSWLEPAGMLLEEAIVHFSAPGGTFFNLASDEGPRLVASAAELSDNVIPSSNSVMASNLATAGILLNRTDYAERAVEMVRGMIPDLKRNPGFHANWFILLQDLVTGIAEVKIEAEDPSGIAGSFNRHYLPGVVFSYGGNGATRYFVCRDRSCFHPVGSVEEALGLLNGNRF